jgi:hypothetical protein
MRSTDAVLALCLAAGVLVPARIASAADATANGEFSATAVVETPHGTRRMAFTVVVSNPLTKDEAMHYRDILARDGQHALANAIRGSMRGQFRLGAVEYPIDLVVAEPDRGGFKYIVVSCRPLQYEEVAEGSGSLDHPFTVLVFQVPSIGKGDGAVYTRSALYIDDAGYPQVDQYDRRPGKLQDVKREK